jgi:hypothetical protein
MMAIIEDLRDFFNSPTVPNFLWTAVEKIIKNEGVEICLACLEEKIKHAPIVTLSQAGMDVNVFIAVTLKVWQKNQSF